VESQADGVEQTAGLLLFVIGVVEDFRILGLAGSEGIGEFNQLSNQVLSLQVVLSDTLGAHGVLDEASQHHLFGDGQGLGVADERHQLRAVVVEVVVPGVFVELELLSLLVHLGGLVHLLQQQAEAGADVSAHE